MSDVLAMASDIGAWASPELAMRWIETNDPMERAMIERLYSAIAEKKMKIMHNHATDIANSVGKLFAK